MNTKYFILSLLCATTLCVNAMENNGRKRKLSDDESYMDMDPPFAERTVKPRHERQIDQDFLDHPEYLTMRDLLKSWRYVSRRQIKAADIACILERHPATVPTLGYNQNKEELNNLEYRITALYAQMTGCQLEFKNILNIASQLKWI